jgi:hypothetical protein
MEFEIQYRSISIHCFSLEAAVALIPYLTRKNEASIFVGPEAVPVSKAFPVQNERLTIPTCAFDDDEPIGGAQ